MMAKTSNARNLIICIAVTMTFLGAGLHMNVIKLPITNTIIYQWGSELGSYEGTMEAASNVFVGKVIRQAGTKARFEIPVYGSTWKGRRVLIKEYFSPRRAVK